MLKSPHEVTIQHKDLDEDIRIIISDKGPIRAFANHGIRVKHILAKRFEFGETTHIAIQLENP